MLKVLCLHGYGANGQFMKEYQTKKMQKLFPFLEMEHLDGPFDLNPVMVRDPFLQKKIVDKKFKSWKKQSVMEGRHLTLFPTCDEGIQTIIDAIERLGGIDGIISFSMGGMFLIALLVGLENGTIDPKYRPKFVFVVGSGATGLPLTKPIRIPSVHICGEIDETGLYGPGLATSAYFLDPLLITHEEGHKFPVFDRSDVNKLLRFFKPILLKKYPEMLKEPKPKL